MEQTEETSNDGNRVKRNGEEGFSWEEWTVIQEGNEAKNLSISQPVEHDGSSSDTSYSEIDNTSDAEEARESNRILSEQNFEIRHCERVICRNEESDGISVITESESDVAFVNENDNKIIVYKRVDSAVEKNGKENIFKEETTFVNLFIACSMIIAIGIGIGIKLYGKHSISKEIDYMNIKMEHDKLLEQMKELSSVKAILEEIKTSVIQQRIQDSSKFQDPTTDEIEQLPYLKKHLKSLDSTFNDSGTTLFERLQIFLRTICLILEDIRQPSVTNNARQSMCDNHSYLADLAGSRIMLNSVIDEMDDSTKTTNQRFLENIELQMRSMSDSLVSDLTRSLDKLYLKNQRKVGKIVYKLNERLCMLRNTMPSDSKVRISLEMNDTFVENCDKIAMKKFTEAKKQKWKSESSIVLESSKVERQKSKIRRDKSDTYEKSSRGYESKQQNETKSYSAYRKNAWKTRKCYKLDNLAADSEINEDSCSMLMAPPRSTFKLRRKQSFPQSPEPVEVIQNVEAENGGRKEAAELRLKGDQVSSKYSKKKTKRESDRPKNEPIFASRDRNDFDPMKRTKLNSPTVSQNKNSHVKDKEKFLTKPAVQGVKRRFDKENNEPERRKENGNVGANGNWQFERSRIRDELRKDESAENWYFDRAVNRENSRIDHGEPEDPR